MAAVFKQDIESFKDTFATLVSLRDPALGERQWDEIRQLVVSERPAELVSAAGIPEEELFKDLNQHQYTLKFVLDLQMDKMKEPLQEIALKAVKEAELVKMLQSVELFWKSAFFIVTP